MTSERRSCLEDGPSITTGRRANARESVIGSESNLKDKLAKKNGFAPNGRVTSAARKGPLIVNLRATIAESHERQRIDPICEIGEKSTKGLPMSSAATMKSVKGRPSNPNSSNP